MKNCVTQQQIDALKNDNACLKQVMTDRGLTIVKTSPRRVRDVSISYTLQITGPDNAERIVTGIAKRDPRDVFNKTYGHEKALYRALKSGLAAFGIGVHRPQAQA